MSDKEIEAIGHKNQIVEKVAFVTSSDDLTIKVWALLSNNQFHCMKEILNQHGKEIYVIKVIQIDDKQRSKLNFDIRNCTNLIFSGENGCVKV